MVESSKAARLIMVALLHEYHMILEKFLPLVYLLYDVANEILHAELRFCWILAMLVQVWMVFR